MGKKYVIDESTLTNIADAIRENTGSTEPIAVKDFANKISECGFSIPSDELVRVVFHNTSTKPGGYGWINGSLFDENGSLISYWGGDLVFEEPCYLSAYSYYTIEVDHSQSFYGADVMMEDAEGSEDGGSIAHIIYGAMWVGSFYGSQAEVNVSIEPPSFG